MRSQEEIRRELATAEEKVAALRDELKALPPEPERCNLCAVPIQRKGKNREHLCPDHLKSSSFLNALIQALRKLPDQKIRQLIHYIRSAPDILIEICELALRTRKKTERAGHGEIRPLLKRLHGRQALYREAPE